MKQEVDLLLNDGSKHINIADWRKNTTLPQRVENGRRRSRRCLLMSLALAKTPVQQVFLLLIIFIFIILFFPKFRFTSNIFANGIDSICVVLFRAKYMNY